MPLNKGKMNGLMPSTGGVPMNEKLPQMGKFVSPLEAGDTTRGLGAKEVDREIDYMKFQTLGENGVTGKSAMKEAYTSEHLPFTSSNIDSNPGFKVHGFGG